MHSKFSQMAIQKPSIPKGTRDFSPEEVCKRQYIFDKIRHQFQLFGYAPIETPSFENLSTLTGKYGEEGDRLIFKILNSGDYFVQLKISIKEYFKILYSSAFYYIVKNSIDDNIDYTEFYKHFKSDSNINSQKRFYESDFINIDNLRIREIFENEMNSILKEASFNSYIVNTYNENKVSDFIDFKESNYVKILMESSFLTFFSELPSNTLTSQISEKALRYDLTVPFARYVVQHQNEISLPFKRYQMQPVWRADRPQKGRFREFYQCDADVVGSDSLLQEVELVSLYDSVFNELGVGVEIHFNNRKILSGLAEVANISDKLIDFTVALDKLDKIGEEKVKEEMLQRGISEEAIQILSPLFQMSGDFQSQLTSLTSILNSSEIGMKGIEEVRFVFEKIQKLGLKSSDLVLNLTLARGLDYYTGAILEVKAKGVQLGSIGGGGRYDDLTGIFGLKGLSGVGISFGLDRIYLVIEELNLFPESIQNSLDVLFINFGEAEADKAMELSMQLRSKGIRCEVYPDAVKMKKQMQYADKKAVKYVVIIGEEELNAGNATLKNMVSGEQSTLKFEELVNSLDI
ncbi:histidyl-tRNA synthetase [Moheibacter stercoris]|uniref:Histidine--tRNA ligase n=2 Tax=Moheibacter stercoris TaxID=1628251 RepID=A0ABV2LUR6_9FLAO